MSLMITWSNACPDTQTVTVIAETEKAYHIRNADNGRAAWIPKSALRQYTPPKYCPRPIDESEKVVADWFKSKCSPQQMAALGYAE